MNPIEVGRVANMPSPGDLDYWRGIIPDTDLPQLLFSEDWLEAFRQNGLGNPPAEVNNIVDIVVYLNLPPSLARAAQNRLVHLWHTPVSPATPLLISNTRVLWLGGHGVPGEWSSWELKRPPAGKASAKEQDFLLTAAFFKGYFRQIPRVRIYPDEVEELIALIEASRLICKTPPPETVLQRLGKEAHPVDIFLNFANRPKLAA